ncbi:hypothetical protein DFH06DRAFT_1002998, partial [Mycena polygramma]
DLYGAEFLRWDGTGSARLDKCPQCPKGVPKYRCRDCHDARLFCKACIVEKHRGNPLHRIYGWTGFYFVKEPLHTLGLRVQLGHPDFSRCTAAEPSKTGFVTLHINGIHDVLVDFCGCEGANAAGPPEVQLLRAGWFPATHERPHTAATFAVLEQFHQETLQAKVTMYDFYGVLEKLTNNAGIKPPDRYHEWIRMCREYRHLMMLKRGGRMRAYDSSGVAGTKSGELAIECPACPRPGVNLPDGWEHAPPEDRFLYTFFLALDACFRLKRRLVSNELKDPGLGTGWAYMVENEPYREYLRTVTDQKEMNTCSGLAALDYANTKFSRGYATTGVGMGICARHEFVQPNGVGDLQRGERFANMDYITGSIYRHKHPRLYTMISYDICCIWSLLFDERMGKLPDLVKLVVVLALFAFVIPKMHIHAHTMACQLRFSLNWTRGSAQTDGEGIEREWASIGGVATSTRDMGPGARHGVLDCQWSYWNWQKFVGIVVALRRRRDRALEELAEQQRLFDEFSREQAEAVPEWKRVVDVYEDDNKNPNPYEIKVVGMWLSEAKVRLQFTQEEAKQAAEGIPAVHNIGPSKFVSLGLDLEEEQRRVRVQAILKKAQTTGMQIDLTAMRTRLSRRVAQFRKLQATYTPAALVALGDMDLPEDQPIEKAPLMLPSAMSVAARRVGCMAGLPAIEALMRDAQCRAALASLRNQLHIKSRLFVYKKHQTRHQGANTRARTIVARNESKIGLHSEKYQMAWEAIRLLRDDGDPNKVGWQVLKRDDIRCMEDTEDLARKQKRAEAAKAKRGRWTSQLLASGILPSEQDDDMEVDDDDGAQRVPENRRKVSWIWTVAGTSGTDAEVQNALRIEWSKAYARTNRWKEELRLVEAEYARVLESSEHEAQRWERRARAVPIGVLPVLEVQGAIFFATRQAAMFRDIASRAVVTWTEVKIPRGKKRARPEVPAIARPALAVDALRADAGDDPFVDPLDGPADDIFDEEDERELALGGIDSDDEEFLFSGVVEDD